MLSNDTAILYRHIPAGKGSHAGPEFGVAVMEWRQNHLRDVQLPRPEVNATGDLPRFIDNRLKMIFVFLQFPATFQNDPRFR